MSSGSFQPFSFKFELTCALAYILPKKYRLSVSLIGCISTLVIAAVVWLTLVFFSATEGFETRWSKSITSLLGEVRISPTAAYYDTPAVKIDSYAEKSGFRIPYLDDKAVQVNNLYNPATDPPVDFLPDTYPNQAMHNPAQHLLYILALPACKQAGITYLPFRSATASFELYTPTTTINQLSLLLAYPQLPPEVSKLLVHGKADLPNKETILLSKAFLPLGAAIGCRGKFEYTHESISGPLQQGIFSTVTGFFDPGILPIGGKLILTTVDLINIIQSEPQAEALLPSMGYALWSKNISPEKMKEFVQEELQKAKIDSLFRVETYKEFEFTKDLFLQLSSERNLFRLLALIIIIVASSNITSLLLILVFTKKQEIAVLRAFGASKKQIGSIFTLAGLFIGSSGLLLGVLTAGITMHFLPNILDLLGKLQGHDVLAQAFYGSSVPTNISSSALTFVLISTLLISALSGAFAAISACRLNISQALKGE